MSSATAYEPGRVRKLLAGLKQMVADGYTAQRQGGSGQSTGDIEKIMRLGMTPRQQRLNHLYAWYRCAHYDTRRIDWNGKEVLDPIEHEAIASAGFIPPGFYDAGALLPIKFRRPSAPYGLVKVVVDRFTSFLFSERQHPYVYVAGDDDTNDYAGALIEASRLWPSMIQARRYGGSMGSVCVGFQFIDGVPRVEVHDPRWVNPDFIDRDTLRLRGIEKRYMYPEDERDPHTGKFVTNWYWYRRTIDEQKDTLFAKAPVGKGEEPDWQVEREVEHGFGFCPCIWVQNQPVQEDVDGDPDCEGIYDNVEAIDQLISMANKGTIANSDPTLSIVTDADMSEISKGSDNAIKLPAGSSANYLEIQGSGPKAALEMAAELRKLALEVTQCVLDHPEMSVRTATEIERVYSSMLAKADILREQYGQRCVLPLVEMMLAAARKIGETTSVDEQTGETVRQTIVLPKRVTTNDETGESEQADRKLGPGGPATILWPRFFQLGLADIELAVRSAGQALAAGLLDLESAVRFVAEYFNIRDVGPLIEKLLAAKDQASAQMAQQAMGGGAMDWGQEEYGGGEEPLPEEE